MDVEDVLVDIHINSRGFSQKINPFKSCDMSILINIYIEIFPDVVTTLSLAVYCNCLLPCMRARTLDLSKDL